MNKIMFEIYRVPAGPYRVIYYTELDEDSRDDEIQRALEGEHVYEGYLREATILHAKMHIERCLRRLNDGAPFDRVALERELSAHLDRGG